MTMQQYCLRWNNHQPNFISVFSSLLNNESLVDVTLATEGKHLQAHKVVLSACSSYFQTLFTINPCQHPIVILKDVKFSDLKVMVDFMYYGEVNVSQDQLPHILKTAEMLKIKGLAEIPVDQASVSKTLNSSTDKVELLMPGDSIWSTDNSSGQGQLSSPCPLSPSSKRKRLRKSSTGSGSESIERGSEEQPASDISLPGAGKSDNGTVETVIKTDSAAYSTENNSISQQHKHHHSDTEEHRESSHENKEAINQVTLQIPQETSVPHSLETTHTLDGPGPSTTSSQISLTGMQWNVLDQSAYAQFSSCTTSPSIISNQIYTHSSPNAPHQNSQQCFHNQINSSPSQMMPKRKRSINPQGDENFIRALDAVRYGGIGFCKAARMYGVNNRTLWLEYKKRGYPNFRLSIKNRTKQDLKPDSNEPNLENKTQTETFCVTSSSTNNHPVALLGSAFFEGKHIDLPVFQRPKHVDTVISAQQNVNFHSINFEQM